MFSASISSSSGGGGRGASSTARRARRGGVPSMAALRVLYQLAYITSGTAVGMGVLCAEERRRRTVVVQRIADNARRIRQSPRYVHGGAAVANARLAEGLDGPGWSGGDGGKDAVQALLDTRGRRSMGVRVDAGNEGRRDGKDNDHFTRRNVVGGRGNPSETPGSSSWGFGFEVTKRRTGVANADASRMDHALPRMSPRRVAIRDVLSPAPPDRAKSRAVGAQALLLETLRKTEHAVLEDMASYKGMDYSRFFATAGVWERGRSTSLPSQLDRTAQMDESPRPTQSASRKAISRDVAVFLKWASKTRSETISTNFRRAQASISKQLLLLACHSGSVDDIRALVSYRSSLRILTSDEITKICLDAAALAARTERDTFIALYRDVLSDRLFKRADEATQLRLIVEVFTQAYCRWPDSTEPDLLECLLGDRSRDIAVQLLLPDIRRKCGEIMTLDGPVKAAGLLLAIVEIEKKRNPKAIDDLLKPSSVGDKTFVGLFADVFAACLAGAEISSAAQLIDMHLTSPESLEYSPHLHRPLNSLLAQSKNSSHRAVLLDFYGRWLRKGIRMDAVLNQRTRATLAITGRAESFLPSDASRTDPEYTRFEFPALVRHELVVIWHQTRNIKLIKAEYALLHTQMMGDKSDFVERELAELEFTYLECCVKAGLYKEVTERLAHIHATGQNNVETATLAALILAKRQAWEELDKLTEIVKHWPSKSITDGSIQRLNLVLTLCCGSRGSEPAWDLLVKLVDNWGFKPIRMTLKVLLKSAVVGDKVHSIPERVQWLRRKGLSDEFDAYLVAWLLRQYYRAKRPPATIMFPICRQLTDSIPSFDRRPFLNVLTEALTYDLRERSGGSRAKALRALARRRIDLVRSADNEIPYLGSLYGTHTFSDSDPSRDPALKRIDSPVEEEFGPGTAPASVSEYSPLPLSVQSVQSMQSVQSLDPVQSNTEEPPSDSSRSIQNSTQEFEDDDATPPVDPAREYESGIGIPFGPVLGYQPPTEVSLQPETAELGDSQQLSDQRLLHTLDDDTSPSPAGYHRVREFFHRQPTYTEDLAGIRAGPNWVTASPVCQDDVDTELYWSPLDLRKSPTSTTNNHPRKCVERDMITAYSLRQYDEVVELYRSSLNPRGLTTSTTALEITLSASLRRNSRDSTEAEEILLDARRAGMDTFCAIGPLLINRMRNLDTKSGSIDVTKLRKLVEEYYTNNRRRGRRAKHDVAVTAADTLIKAGRAAPGIDILTYIYQSEITGAEKPEIALMTCFLQGYAELHSIEGIQWVIKTVLERGVLIDERFIAQFSCTRRHLCDGVGRGTARGMSGSVLERTKLGAVIESWKRACVEKRQEQKKDALRAGQDFVKTIVKCASNLGLQVGEVIHNREESNVSELQMLQSLAPDTCKSTPDSTSTVDHPLASLDIESSLEGAPALPPAFAKDSIKENTTASVGWLDRYQKLAKSSPRLREDLPETYDWNVFDADQSRHSRSGSGQDLGSVEEAAQ